MKALKADEGKKDCYPFIAFALLQRVTANCESNERTKQ